MMAQNAKPSFLGRNGGLGWIEKSVGGTVTIGLSLRCGFGTGFVLSIC